MMIEPTIGISEIHIHLHQESQTKTGLTTRIVNVNVTGHSAVVEELSEHANKAMDILLKPWEE